MTKSTQVLLSILLLAVTLAVGYWFYNNFTWVEKDEDVGFQGAAKTNKLLAAEFFLRKMGVKTQQINGLAAFRDLPSTQHTILIATQRETLNIELSQELLNWVKSGGHLIVEARYPEDNNTDNAVTENVTKNVSENKNRDVSDNQSAVNDDLLEKYSVFVTESDADEESSDVPVLVTLIPDSQEKAIEVNFPYQKILKQEKISPEPDWLINDQLGDYLMQFTLEQGILTVLTSTDIFTNEQIADYDHARFLHYLVQKQGHDAGVWLFRVDDMPALWLWLWNNAWYSMLCLTILFFLWLWRAPLRFGPVLNDVQTERRSLMEHIQASGYYRWHEQQSGFLLAKVQESVWEKIQTSHPVVRRENPVQAYALLEEITSIKESLIRDALTPIKEEVKELDEHEFTKMIRTLEIIRKHL